MRYRQLTLCLLSVLFSSPLLAEEWTSRIEGAVHLEDGTPLIGVRVTVDELGETQLTDEAGTFAFKVPAGTFTLLIVQDPHRHEQEVDVDDAALARVDITVDWQISFMDQITVTSASRKAQRIVDAPAAVTLVSAKDIERQSSHGQLPRLLEFTPGAEVTQSGLYDFKLNVRGFNTGLGRRVLTLVDGRDIALPSLGVQEWGATSLPLDDLASAELVRGPGSALYGADAFNGVLNLTTKAPRDHQGGSLRLTVGELDSYKVDLRHSGALGNDGYWKLLASTAASDDFSRSRNTGVEYSVPCAFAGQADCVLPEVIPLLLDRDELWSASLRYDKHWQNNRVMTLEAGSSYLEGPVIAAGLGRTQMTDVERPWARWNFNTPHWNVLAYYTGRNAADQTLLASGTATFLDEDRFSLEVQGNISFGDGKGFAVGGASWIDETVDTANPQGFQTLSFEALDGEFKALFGQIEYALNDRLQGLLAARWDDSSLHESRFSPRASLVYALTPSSSLRLAYSEAFQTPNYAEFFQAVPVAPPVSLAPFEGICALGGVSCGFGSVPILAVGNEDLEVEEIRSLEFGYSGVLGDNVFLTVDVYDNQLRNFITDLIGFVNPVFGGPIHDNFPAYRPPAGLGEPFASMLLGALAFALPPDLFAILSNAPDGSPIFTALSHVNFAEVEARGLEVGVNAELGGGFALHAGYSYFDFEIERQLPDDPVLPNAPGNQLQLGLRYTASQWDLALSMRYSEAFDWSSGLYEGRVPSYEVADLTANYRFDERWSAGLDVSNLFDNEHFQIFGGDLLGRRALAHVKLSW